MGILIKNKVERTEDALKAKRQYLSEKEKYDNSSRMRRLFTAKPVDPVPEENIEQIQKRYDIEQKELAVQEQKSREREAKLEEIRNNPKPIEELYAMYEEYDKLRKSHDALYMEKLQERTEFYRDNLDSHPKESAEKDVCRELEPLEKQLLEQEESLSWHGISFTSEMHEYSNECRLLVCDKEYYKTKSEKEKFPVVFGWDSTYKNYCLDGSWPNLEMVVGSVIMDSPYKKLCPKLAEIKGHLWILNSDDLYLESGKIFALDFLPELKKVDRVYVGKNEDVDLIVALDNHYEKTFDKDMLSYDITEFQKLAIATSALCKMNSITPGVKRKSFRDVSFGPDSSIFFKYTMEYQDHSTRDCVGVLKDNILYCYDSMTNKHLAVFNLDTKEYKNMVQAQRKAVGVKM